MQRRARMASLFVAVVAGCALVASSGATPALADSASYLGPAPLSECPGEAAITSGTGLPTDHVSRSTFEAPCFAIPETASTVTVSLHDDHDIGAPAMEVVVQRSQDDNTGSWTFYACNGSLTLDVFAVDDVSVFPLDPAQAATYTHGACINPNVPTTGTITVDWNV